jgi:hypothetical protein
MKNQIKSIYVIVLCIMIIFIALWLSSVVFNIVPERIKDLKLNPERIENEVVSDEKISSDADPLQPVTDGNKTLSDDKKILLERIRDTTQLPVSKWEFNPANNELIYYTYDIQDASVMTAYQGKRIGNYSIRIIHDTEFEKTREEVHYYLSKLRNDPTYEIANIWMETDMFGLTEGYPAYYAELWVYNSTPQNKDLNFKKIKGWTIMVYPLTKSIQMQKQMEKMAEANKSVTE